VRRGRFPRLKRRAEQAELAKKTIAQIKPIGMEVVDALTPTIRAPERADRSDAIEATSPLRCRLCPMTSPTGEGRTGTFILKVGDPKNSLAKV